MAKRDYYEVLGVDEARLRGRDQEGLPQAGDGAPSRPQSGRPGGRAKFKEVNEAYEVLKDDQKRAAYDRFGHAAFERRRRRARRPRRSRRLRDFAAAFADIFDDLFGEFMGGGGAARRGQRAGARRRPALQPGDHARRGLRRQEGDDPRAAARRLRDLQRHRRRGPAPQPTRLPDLRAAPARCARQQGFFTIERTCPTCQGRGRDHQEPLQGLPRRRAACRSERTLTVNIPPGVEDGTRIRLTGEGEAGLRGGPTGDLYIFLSIKPHALFQRDGAEPLLPRADLDDARRRSAARSRCRRSTAARRACKVPAGTQTGKQFRLRGKGMPVLRSQPRAGDMYIQVEVETPKNLTKPPAGAAARVRGGRPRQQPGDPGLLRQGEGVLGRPARRRRTAPRTHV